VRTVAEHLAAVLDGIVPLEPVELPLLDARGLVLARDLVAPWPLPSFDNSSMDGYAVHAADVAGAGDASPKTLPVLGDLAAGASSNHPVASGTCVRIMTGAPMPPGADAVVPVELTDGGTEHRQHDPRIRRLQVHLRASGWATTCPRGTTVAARR
jgi:molybdopterin molybdotransferase